MNQEERLEKIITEHIKSVICAIGVKCPRCNYESGMKSLDFWYEKDKISELARAILKEYIHRDDVVERLEKLRIKHNGTKSGVYWEFVRDRNKRVDNLIKDLIKCCGAKWCSCPKCTIPVATKE